MGQRALERVEERGGPGLRKYGGKNKVHEAGGERLKGITHGLSS